MLPVTALPSADMVGPRAIIAAQTMFDKIWGRHVVAVEEGEALLYVDRAVAPGFIDEELRAPRQNA